MFVAWGTFKIYIYKLIENNLKYCSEGYEYEFYMNLITISET